MEAVYTKPTEYKCNFAYTTPTISVILGDFLRHFTYKIWFERIFSDTHMFRIPTESFSALNLPKKAFVNQMQLYHNPQIPNL